MLYITRTLYSNVSTRRRAMAGGRNQPARHLERKEAGGREIFSRRLRPEVSGFAE
ncbi:MAG: hypothetical protein KKH32_05540 [Bacteroidetes bacterium]|nr:hypothetical protein [Bacteroidota bacterium]